MPVSSLYEDVGPWPVTVEVEPVSDCLGYGAAELSGAADALRPAGQVVGREAELHPHIVADDVVEQQVRESGRFRAADHVSGAHPLALLQFECSDVVVAWLALDA